MILTRKIQLIPVGDKEEANRVYSYLRDGIFNQNKAMNQYLSALYTATIQEASKEDRQELNRLYTRIATSKKGSAYQTDIEFPKGLPIGAFGMKVRQDFAKQCKDGLLYGKVSLATYKKDNPLLIHVDYVRLRKTNPHLDNGMYHNYESHQEFLDHLYSNDLEIFIKFANKITFKLIFGNPRRSAALRSEIKEIFEEHYKICGSSIQIDGKKIILNMSMEIPKEEAELDEDTVVGVDLGIAVPAMCALNNNMYVRAAIGNKDDFLRIRTKIQAQRRRLQHSLKYTSGGYGRNKKLKALEKLKKSEAHFVETYNHMVSRRIVDFAVKNHAKYINVENLTGYNTSKFILRNWSFSQVCSVCGYWEEGQRKSQSVFECANPNCESHTKYEYGFNADFNAARNIAMSTLLMEKGEVTEKSKQEAREYYGIIS